MIYHSLLRVITIGHPSTAKLTGKVRDAGTPLEGVRVNIQPADSMSEEGWRNTKSSRSEKSRAAGVSFGQYG